MVVPRWEYWITAMAETCLLVSETTFVGFETTTPLKKQNFAAFVITKQLNFLPPNLMIAPMRSLVSLTPLIIDGTQLQATDPSVAYHDLMR